AGALEHFAEYEPVALLVVDNEHAWCRHPGRQTHKPSPPIGPLRPAFLRRQRQRECKGTAASKFTFNYKLAAKHRNKARRNSKAQSGSALVPCILGLGEWTCYGCLVAFRNANSGVGNREANSAQVCG